MAIIIFFTCLQGNGSEVIDPGIMSGGAADLTRPAGVTIVRIQQVAAGRMGLRNTTQKLQLDRRLVQLKRLLCSLLTCRSHINEPHAEDVRVCVFSSARSNA